MWGLSLMAAGAAVLGLLAGPASAYAPPGRPGPRLSVAPSQLAAALHCDQDLRGATRTPILLVPGTTLNPVTDYSYGWEPALAKVGIPWCAVALPGNAMGDIQIAGEYVVSAIRTMHAAYGARIDILGHSQGGMVPRWALRFWPDTRAMVNDLVGFSPSNHGTVDAFGACVPGCAPSIWQQRTNAHFMAALNSVQETFPGISYTDIYTLSDEVVVPNAGPTASSRLSGGGGAIANVAIQQVCPADITEHIGIGIYDHTAYALAIDALTHPGPAEPARIDPSTCLTPLMPGINPLTFPEDYAQTLTSVASTLAGYPHTSAEPRLACYTTTAGCSARRATGHHHRSRRHGH
jgi:hypothetical protein